MRAKLKPFLCYIAGTQARPSEPRSRIGIATNIRGMEERFIELSVKELGIMPSKVVIEESRGMHHIYFYHSRLYRELRDIIESSPKLFRQRNEYSRSYIAGMFDANGHIDRNGIYINGLSTKSLLVLQGLGVYTRGRRIMNISQFIALIKGFSVLLEHMHVPGNERDPR